MPPDLTTRTNRVTSIDIVRGAIMLIMAIDHVRDFTHQGAMSYNPTDVTTATPWLFLTRWITHFCAPVFVFLSGMSAYIAGQRKTKKELSAFLIRRGLWLVLVELLVITLALSFDPFYKFFYLQVIWATGWSMVILGLLVRGSYSLVVISGIILFFGHNITDYITVASAMQQGLPSLSKEHPGTIFWLVMLTSRGNVYGMGGGHIVMIVYAILPWTAIMLLGYSFGKLYRNGVASAERASSAMKTGLALTGLFILLRFIGLYGDPAPWSVQRNALYTIFSFVNVTKYPPSLMYSCMTIGPALIALSLLERVHSRFTKFLSVYGKVPFFYYVLHFFLVHTSCVILFFAQGNHMAQAVDPRTPFVFRTVELGVSLPWVYVIWLAIILVLYYPCRWFASYKQRHTQWWLSYL